VDLRITLKHCDFQTIYFAFRLPDLLAVLAKHLNKVKAGLTQW